MVLVMETRNLVSSSLLERFNDITQSLVRKGTNNIIVST